MCYVLLLCVFLAATDIRIINNLAKTSKAAMCQRYFMQFTRCSQWENCGEIFYVRVTSECRKSKLHFHIWQVFFLRFVSSSFRGRDNLKLQICCRFFFIFIRLFAHRRNIYNNISLTLAWQALSLPRRVVVYKWIDGWMDGWTDG